MIDLWAFLAVTIPIVLTPGSSTAIVLRNSLHGGTAAGLHTALGANTGSLCFGVMSALGFAIALARWPAVWPVLRVLGCVYLVYLGGRSLTRAVWPPVPPVVAIPDHRPSAHRNFREGFVTNVSNPALATFYFILLPQFIPRGASVIRGALILTAIHIGLAFPYHTAWAAAGGTLSHLLTSGRPRRILDAVAGIALIALALKLLR